MTFEIISFVVMAAGAYGALLSRSRGYVYSWVAIFFVYSVAVRSTLPSNDMVNYVAAFGAWPPPITPYTIREPVIWFGLPLLGLIIDEAVVAFVVIDLVTCLVLIWGLQRLDDGSGRLLSIAPMLMSSFVFLFGQQNILRQHVALVVFVWASSYDADSPVRATIFFAIASLTHNAVILLSGHWLDGRTRSQLGWMVTAVGMSVLPLLVGLIGKSWSATGANTTLAYVGFFVVTALAVSYSSGGRRIMETPYSSWRNYLMIIPLMFVLGEAQFERVSMMFVVVIVISLFRYYRIWRIRWSVLANAVYLALIMPVFLVPSAFQMLRT